MIELIFASWLTFLWELDKPRKLGACECSQGVRQFASRTQLHVIGISNLIKWSVWLHKSPLSYDWWVSILGEKEAGNATAVVVVAYHVPLCSWGKRPFLPQGVGSNIGRVYKLDCYTCGLYMLILITNSSKFQCFSLSSMVGWQCNLWLTCPSTKQLPFQVWNISFMGSLSEAFSHHRTQQSSWSVPNCHASNCRIGWEVGVCEPCCWRKWVVEQS